jgi:hypothetical protein
MRFDDQVIGRMLRLRWWDYCDEGLQAIQELFLLAFTNERDRAIALLDEASVILQRYPLRQVR